MSTINLDNIVLIGLFRFQFFDQNPPPRYLVCDGSEINTVKYANLFNIIGTTFGKGDGSSTFNIPDMRFVRGYDPRPGSTGKDPCDK